MHKAILIGLSLVAAIGLIYIATQSRRAAPDPAEKQVVAPSPAAPDAQPVTPASEQTPPPATAPPASAPQATAPVPKPDPRIDRIDGKIFLNDPIDLTRRMHSDSTSPADDVSALGTALHFYQRVFKENPVGSLNEEIISQLVGNNPKGIVVIPPDHPDINANGELLDRWGTPYFFHGLTRTAMDVWSAGPDEKFGTIDDVKLGVDEEFREQLGLVIDP